MTATDPLAALLRRTPRVAHRPNHYAALKRPNTDQARPDLIAALEAMSGPTLIESDEAETSKEADRGRAVPVDLNDLTATLVLGVED